MFDGIFHRRHKSPEVEKAQQESYAQKIEPMKNMLAAFSSLIQDEIHNHPGQIDPNSDYQLIVRNPAKNSEGIMGLRDVHKNDLEEILQKIADWADDKSGHTQLPLQPREIEILQQIVNAIERKELVIKQNDQYISNDDSAIYNAILNQAYVMEKADHLAQQKIIGRKSDGEIVLGDYSERENLIGVYDVLDYDEEKSGRYFGEKIFGSEEYKPEEEKMVYSPEQIQNIREHHGTFTENFHHAEDSFIQSVLNLGNSLKQQAKEKKAEIEPLAKDQKPTKSEKIDELASTRNTVDLAKAIKDMNQVDQVREIHRTSKKVFRHEQRRLEREARKERDANKRLEKRLDKNYETIQREQREYDRRHEQDPPHSKAA